jgi:hypothetical protein
MLGQLEPGRVIFQLLPRLTTPLYLWHENIKRFDDLADSAEIERHSQGSDCNS